MQKLNILIKRLNKIGVSLTLSTNYPWIYLDEINGKKVKEKFESEHGFVIAYVPIRVGQDLKIANIKELFNLIREYEGRTK